MGASVAIPEAIAKGYMAVRPFRQKDIQSCLIHDLWFQSLEMEELTLSNLSKSKKAVRSLFLSLKSDLRSRLPLI